MKVWKTVEKIREKIVPLALIVVLVDIAYIIFQGVNKTITAFSLETRGTTFTGILHKATEILRFELIVPLSIFLLLSVYLPSFEKHARKLRIAGVITVLFMHFGNFISFQYLSKHLFLSIILFVVYSILLLAFLSKRWLPLSMIAFGVIFVVSPTALFLTSALSIYLLIPLTYGLILITLGITNLRRNQIPSST